MGIWRNPPIAIPQRIRMGVTLAFILLIPTMTAASQPLRGLEARAPSLLALNRQIAASADDAAQYGGPGSPFNPLTLSQLLGDNGMDPFTNGFRFENIDIPQYATITLASLLFTAFSDETGAITLTIHGHDAGNSPTFAPGNGPADREPDFTSASAPWSPSDWSAGSMYQTPDISPIIQEIVDRGDWSTGAAVSLIIQDDGLLDGVKRKATAYDWIVSQSAQISIEYVENPGATGPVSPPGPPGGDGEEPEGRVPPAAADTDGGIAGNFMANPGMFSDQTLAIPLSPPDLIITSLMPNQSGYTVGQSYQLEIEVRNNGSSSAGPFQVEGEIGRLVFQSETSAAIEFLPDFILADAPGLGAGESLTLVSALRTFDGLPLDFSQTTPSEIPGLPNNGTVLFRARADSANTVDESHEDNNVILASAIYPSGPANPSYDPSLDADGDGWMAPEDCDDTNPRIYPGAYEYNDTTDSNCDGTDEGVTGEGFSGLGGLANIGLLFGDPTMWLYLFKSEYDLDLDQDGYPHSEDCNDFNAAQHPGAEELPDGLDNDCDALVDEGYLIPDFTFSHFEMSRTPYICDAEYCGVSYELDLEYASGDIGNFALWQAENAVQIKDLSGQVFSIGREGLIPYSQFPSYAYAESMACDASGLFAILPSGAYGEENLSNNWAVAFLETLGGPDLEIRFDDNDFIQEITRDIIRIRHESVAGGSCPPRDIIDYLVRISVDVDGVRVFETEELIHNEDNPFGPSFQHNFSSRVHGGDEIRVEIELNSDGRHNEDISNNLCVIEGTFRRPFQMSGFPPSAGFDTFLEIESSQGCDLPPSQTQQGLSVGTGPSGAQVVLIGLVGLVLGGVGAGVGWRVAGALGAPQAGMVAAAVLTAGVLGSGSILGGISIVSNFLEAEQVVPSPAQVMPGDLSESDILSKGAFFAGDQILGDDLALTFCSNFVETSYSLLPGPEAPVSDVLFHFGPNNLVPEGSRYRLTLWGENGIPHELVTDADSIGLASAGLFPSLGDLILWQTGIETSIGGDLYQSVCIPARIGSLQIPGDQVIGREDTGVDILCEEILSVRRRGENQLMVTLNCPGVLDGDYPALVDGKEYVCIIDSGFPDRLFCVGAASPTGTRSDMQVLDSGGEVVFEGDFVVPPPPPPTPTPPPAEPTKKPTKPGPTPTKGS